jgi:Tfp pilus assembly protein FimV
MAAVAHASPASLRRLALVPTGAAPLSAASTVRSARALSPPVVYRRRRAAALTVVVIAGAALVLALQGILSALGGGPLTSPQRPVAPTAVYVVQPGDTFWDIARRLHPGDDPRPLVARMVAAHGSPVLVAGERLPLPVAA